MIVTKRTYKLLLRLCLICAGAGLTIFAWYLSVDTRTIIRKFVESRSLQEQIWSMQPQNEEEFWRDFNTAIVLNAKAQNPFSMSDADIARYLMMNPTVNGMPGTGTTGVSWAYKHWASVELYNRATGTLVYWYQMGPGRFYESTHWDRANQEAFTIWRYRPYVFWSKLLGSVGLGGAFVWFGLLFLPYVLLLLISALVLTGKVVPTTASYTHDQIIVHVSSSSGDAPHHSSAHAAAVPAPQIGWLVVWAMLLTVVIRDTRWVTRGIRTMSTRAPPFRKESVMLRLIVALCLLLGASPVLAASPSLHVVMGEQPNAKGITALVIVGSGNFTGIPVFFYDGVTGFETFGTYTITDSIGSVEFKLSPGLGLGGINGERGITPYGAAHLGYAINCQSYNLSGSFSARHSAEQRFNHLFVANLAREWSRFAVGVAYQPILITSWEQRVAINGWKKFGITKVGGEVRISLDERRRTSMHVDVEVPLK